MRTTEDQARLLAAIAAELGPTWRASAADENAELIGPDVALYMHAEEWRRDGKLHFGLSCNGLHQYLGYNQHSPTIGVDGKRGAKAIAADIGRRLLPEAVAFYWLLAERKAAHDATEARRRQLLERLAEALGLSAPDPQTQRAQDGRMYGHVGPVHVEITCQDGRAELKLDDVPADTAERICALLRQAFTQAAGDN